MATAIRQTIAQYFFRGVSTAPLVAFRIIFGALMLFGTTRFVWKGWVSDLYIEPDFYFTYLGFEWVKPLPGEWMYLPFLLIIAASTGMILGLRYRISAIVLFVCFTYVELLDKTNYLNHYYFVSIIAFLLCWLPANAGFSIDAKRNPAIRRTTVPGWTILLLQLQLGIVYCCAGIAKLHTDWLFEAQPLKIWLQAFRDTPYIGNWFASSWLAFVFSWFGCVYDLTIPFFLSFRKTRPVAYFFVVVFHLATWILFPIGVFPWVMIFTTLIFFPASFHERWINRLNKWLGWQEKADAPSLPLSPNRRRVIGWLLGIYLAFQVLIPFRYVLYPGDLFWTEEGFRFSWRVMLMHKDGYATFYIVDPKTKGSIQIRNEDYLTPAQVDQMATQPDMILQFAHYLGEQFRDTVFTYGAQRVHLQHPAVEADVYVTLNGRPNQLYVSRKTNLMNETYTWKHRTWVEQFRETGGY
jgi:hypothetical protein